MKLPLGWLPVEPGTEPWFAQGARCGHLEGKGRAGLYVTGEEFALAEAAAEANVPNGPDLVWVAWANGYCDGYRLRVEGGELPADIVSAPLPQDS